ncbi:universal stress protein [Nitrosopumilus sp. Nsub]|uniref:universal stress protein n=1 Tax=Nitrosopumilus sp. Nsub TaxID=1776294 RepID=UPI0009E82258|nr:universal stress protein [Nitrosopumilus sp. Nsub]
MSKDDIKKILVPFDGSKFSKKAVAKAIRMAEKFGQRFHSSQLFQAVQTHHLQKS